MKYTFEVNSLAELAVLKDWLVNGSDVNKITAPYTTTNPYPPAVTGVVGPALLPDKAPEGARWLAIPGGYGKMLVDKNGAQVPGKWTIDGQYIVG